MKEIKTIAVYGLGQFGFSITKYLAELIDNKNIKIKVFEWNKETLNKIKQTKRHPIHFTNIKQAILPNNIEFVENLKDLVENSDLLVMAIPAQTIRQNMKLIKPYIKNQIILNVAKALEEDSGKTVSTIIKEELGNTEYQISALAGPMIASQFIQGFPTCADIACPDEKTATYLRNFLSSKSLRIYHTTDLEGVEFASASKNVIAIVAGIVEGAFGKEATNTETATIARCKKELVNLMVDKLWINPKTLGSGSLCFDADIDVSCRSGRNRLFGQLLAEKGRKYADEYFKEHSLIAEGFPTIHALNTLAKEHQVVLPIVGKLYDVFYLNSGDIKKAFEELMERPLKGMGSRLECLN